MILRFVYPEYTGCLIMKRIKIGTHNALVCLWNGVIDRFNYSLTGMVIVNKQREGEDRIKQVNNASL